MSNSPLSSPNPKFEFALPDSNSSVLLESLEGTLQFENQVTLSPELLWSEVDNDLLNTVLTQEISNVSQEAEDAIDNKKPRKKRQRKGGENNSTCDLSAVTLTREQLLVC